MEGEKSVASAYLQSSEYKAGVAEGKTDLERMRRSNEHVDIHKRKCRNVGNDSGIYGLFSNNPLDPFVHV